MLMEDKRLCCSYQQGIAFDLELTRCLYTDWEEGTKTHTVKQLEKIRVHCHHHRGTCFRKYTNKWVTAIRRNSFWFGFLPQQEDAKSNGLLTSLGCFFWKVEQSLNSIHRAANRNLCC